MHLSNCFGHQSSKRIPTRYPKKKRVTQTWAANHKKKNLEVKVEIVDGEVFPHVQ